MKKTSEKKENTYINDTTGCFSVCFSVCFLKYDVIKL